MIHQYFTKLLHNVLLLILYQRKDSYANIFHKHLQIFYEPHLCFLQNKGHKTGIISITCFCLIISLLLIIAWICPLWLKSRCRFKRKQSDYRCRPSGAARPLPSATWPCPDHVIILALNPPWSHRVNPLRVD